MKLIDSKLYEVAHEHVGHIKTAAAPTVAHSLSGRLYLSSSGWLLLDVPNALVRGTFDALHESGAELPPRKHGGNLNAHVSVMTKDEVQRIGADKISERGHQFRFTLGPLKEVEPAGWDEMSRCWFIEISSPELKNLRKSYGLSPLPHGDHPFHVTVAVRRKHVLKNNDVKKAESDDKKARISKVLAMYTDKELDGIYVDYHPGPPSKVWLDVMDWGDGKVGGKLHDAFVKIVGKEHVTYVNEGGKPHREDCGGKWHKLAEEAMDKGASIIMPLIRAGGLYTDVAGIRALAAGQKDQPPDPAEEIENDTSYLNQLRPKRKKKPRVVSAETSLTPLSMPPKLAEAVKMIPMQGHRQENDYSCGPGALKTLFDHYDKGESERKIREATDADPEAGTRPEELAEHAGDKGWGDKENYPKDESGHYVVLTGYDADKFYFKDPALGDKPGELLRREMGERWHDQEADGDKTDRLAIPIRKRGNTQPPVVRTQPPEAKKIAASTSQVSRPTRQ
jgi:predicted double-glycine peptidase